MLEERIFQQSDLDALRSSLSGCLLSDKEKRYKVFMPFTQKHMYISDTAFIQSQQGWLPLLIIDEINRPQYNWKILEKDGGNYLQATQFTKKYVANLEHGMPQPRDDFAYDDVTSVLFDENLNVVNTVKMPGYLYATQQVSPVASPISVMGMDTHTSSSDQELKQVGHILDLARERALYSDLDKLILILQDGQDVSGRMNIFDQLLMKQPDTAYALQTVATPGDGSVVDPNGAQQAFSRRMDTVEDQAAGLPSDHDQQEKPNPQAEAHRQLQRRLVLINQNRHDVEMILAFPEKQKIIEREFAQLQKRRDGLAPRASVEVTPVRHMRGFASHKLTKVARMVVAIMQWQNDITDSNKANGRGPSPNPPSSSAKKVT